MESKKILILSHKPPYPKVDGGCIAISQIMEALLEKGHKVTFLCMETDKHPSAYTSKHQNLLYKSIYVNTRVNIFCALKNLITQDSYILSRFKQSKFEQSLNEILVSEEFDTIIFESLFTSEYIHTVKKLSNAKTIYRSHNIEHQIWNRQKEQNSNWFIKKYLSIQANRLKKEEIKFWNLTDHIASISSRDSQHIKTHSVKPVSTLTLYIENRHLEYTDRSTKIDFFHLGAMDWLPNVEAVNWMISEIWPKFTSQFSKSELHLAGRSMPKHLINTKLLGLHNHHEVVNALQFISEHKVMLVPLRSGSGLRVKIIEGMAMGKCIISTSIGVEGIPCTHKKNVLIANTVGEFIDAMQFCIENTETVHTIGMEAKKLALEHFSKNEVTNQLETLL